MPRHKLEILIHVLAVVSVISGFTSSFYLRSASVTYVTQTLDKKEHWLYEYTSNGFLLFGLHCVVAFPSLILIWPSKETKVEKYCTEVVTLGLVFPILVFFLIYISAEIYERNNFGALSSGSTCTNMENHGKRAHFHNSKKGETVCVCRSSRPDNLQVEVPFITCEGYKEYSTDIIVYVVLNVANIVTMSTMLVISCYLLQHHKKLTKATLIRERLRNALSMARSSDNSVKIQKYSKNKSKHKHGKPQTVGFGPELEIPNHLLHTTSSSHAPVPSHYSKVVKFQSSFSSQV